MKKRKTTKNYQKAPTHKGKGKTLLQITNFWKTKIWKNEKWTKKKIITNWDRLRKPCFDDGTNGEKKDHYDF
jgi:hypothetical protein